MPTLRWGIVSAGKICNDFVTAFNSYPGDKLDQEIVAIAARDKTRAATFAKLHNIPKVFDTSEAMATSKDIDIAYIGSLHPDHYPLSKLFLENGKHVICEKPLTLNYKQTKSLIDLARRKKKFLMEAVWSRFSPAYIKLENEINAGKLGDIQFVEANFGILANDVNRLTTKSLGGSAMLDMGIYVLQFAQFVFKEEPLRVTAVGELNEEGVDAVDTVVLEYSRGRRAVLNVHSYAKLWNKGTISGTKGRITVEDPFHFPTEMIHADGTVEEFPLHSASLPYNFGNSSGLAYEAVEVGRRIRQGCLESPRMSHQDTLILAKLLDEVRRQVGVHYDVDDKDFA